MPRLLIAVVAVASAAAGLIGGRATGVPVASVRAAPPDGCASLAPFAEGASTALSGGEGIWAVAGGQLVSVSAHRSVLGGGPSAGGIVKHVATAPGTGTAHVVDRAGDDLVVVVTSEGTLRVPEDAEVSHPAWGPDGDLAWATGSGVAVLDDRSGAIERMTLPVRHATVFSPVFLARDRLAAVVSAPPTAQVPEGERLGNLWATRVGRESWHRLTSFEAGNDRWVTVRTPIVHRGDIHFVKVSGRSSATREPRFELWRLDRGAHRVARLPNERYLAGSSGSRLVWNIPEPAARRHTLAVDGPGGLRTIGCGAVAVDPLDAADPDRAAVRGEHVPARGDWRELAAPTTHETEAVAVIVGDFATFDEAATVAETIRGAFPGSEVDVVDSVTTPLAIRPGVFGALLHLTPEADPTAALSEFRDLVPQYRANSWIVTP